MLLVIFGSRCKRDQSESFLLQAVFLIQKPQGHFVCCINNIPSAFFFFLIFFFNDDDSYIAVAVKIISFSIFSSFF